MKKIIFYITLGCAVVIGGTGCLKDKGYEAQEYGTQIKEKKGVAFPQSDVSPLTIGITGQAADLTVNGTKLTLEEDGYPAADVHITLAVNQNLVTDAGLTPLPAGTFSVNSLNMTIPAGAKISDYIQVTVKNSIALDPNLGYGVGLTITSIDQGYQIASNQKDIVIGFAIKNKYDGVYRLVGHHTRSPYNYQYDTEMDMVTIGPSSVEFYWQEVGSTGHPIGVGPGNDLSWYGADISPAVDFNTTTDLATNIYNLSSAVPIGFYTGTDGGVSRFVDDPTPTNRKMYLYFQYSGNPARGFLDTLTYLRPRD